MARPAVLSHRPAVATVLRLGVGGLRGARRHDRPRYPSRRCSGSHRDLLDHMIAACLDGYPLEACGLIAGREGDDGAAAVTALHPTVNVAQSARVYEVDPVAMLRADREAERSGTALIGVYHSHTHTEAKPSATDIRQAPDPGWHYVLVSLRDTHPSVRSWSIREGRIEEEHVALQW